MKLRHLFYALPVCLGTTGLTANAQNFLPLFEEGKTISTAIMNPSSLWEGDVTTIVYTIKGDTLIDDHLGKKIYSSVYDSETKEYKVKDSLEYLAYEKNNKMYVKNIGQWADDRFHLYFNYNWTKGDTVTLDNFFYLDNDGVLKNATGIINDVSLIDAPNGNKLTKWRFTAYPATSQNELENYWSKTFDFVEGIGLIDNTDFSFHFDMTGPAVCKTMMCQSIQNGTLFDLGRGPIYTGISTVTDTSVPKMTYYDLAGRKLNNKPQKGMYILNGKKYIAH